VKYRLKCYFNEWNICFFKWLIKLWNILMRDRMTLFFWVSTNVSAISATKPIDWQQFGAKKKQKQNRIWREGAIPWLRNLRGFCLYNWLENSCEYIIELNWKKRGIQEVLFPLISIVLRGQSPRKCQLRPGLAANYNIKKTQIKNWFLIL